MLSAKVIMLGLVLAGCLHNGCMEESNDTDTTLSETSGTTPCIVVPTSVSTPTVSTSTTSESTTSSSVGNTNTTIADLGTGATRTIPQPNTTPGSSSSGNISPMHKYILASMLTTLTMYIIL